MLKTKNVGLVTSVIGAVLSAVALYAGNYLSGIKGTLSGIGHMVGESKVGSFLGGEASKKIASYELLIKGCFWAGVALIIIGLVIVIKARKRK
jgi:hypothetical protein